jgi:tetratricopeptide (TPR) repeat protein
MSDLSYFNNPDFAEGLRCQKLGLYPQAFDLFFTIESAGYERTFRKCCEMAWSDQLQERQMDRLFYELDLEVKRKNGIAIFNYGLVMEYLKKYTKASELLNMADELGVPKAREALMRILLAPK